MPGGKIPVLEIEKLTLKKNGRGLYFDDDAANFDVQSWTGTWSGAAGSGFLPAASATAWIRVTDENTDTAYYVPLFNQYW